MPPKLQKQMHGNLQKCPPKKLKPKKLYQVENTRKTWQMWSWSILLKKCIPGNQFYLMRIFSVFSVDSQSFEYF